MRFCEIKLFVRFACLIRLARGNCGKKVIARDCRLFFQYAGSMGVEAGGQVYQLRPGGCLYIPAGVPYRLLLPKEEEAYLYTVNFDFDWKNSASIQAFPLMEHRGERDILCVPEIDEAEFFAQPVFMERTQDMESILQKMEAEFREHVTFSEMVLSAQMSEVLAMIARAQLTEDLRRPQAIEMMIEYIRANIRRPIKNKDVAEAVSYHPNYANFLFLKHTGQTIHQYLISCRIQRALELLLSTELSMTEIALEAGFSSLNRFSKEFSARTGNTPGKYRKRI